MKNFMLDEKGDIIIKNNDIAMIEEISFYCKL